MKGAKRGRGQAYDGCQKREGPSLRRVPKEGGAKPMKGAKRGRGSIDFAILFVRANECYSTAKFINHIKVI